MPPVVSLCVPAPPSLTPPALPQHQNLAHDRH